VNDIFTYCFNCTHVHDKIPVFPFLALFRGFPGLRLAAENLNYFKFDDFPGLSWVFTDSVMLSQDRGRAEGD